MVVDFVGEGLQLKPDFTDLSEKRWLDFVSMIGNSGCMIFGLFEYFIIVSVFVKHIISVFFGSSVWDMISSLVFFILTWQKPCSGILFIKRIGYDLDANVD